MIAALDLSYLFHRTLNVVAGYGKDGKDKLQALSTENKRAIFVRKVATDVAFELRQIPEIQHLIVCKDGRSWRKDLKKSYKESRVRPEEEKEFWNTFYKLMDEVTELFVRQNSLILQHKIAEADDLLFLVADRMSKKGKSLVSLTSDRDIYQTVQANPGEGAIVLINTNSKTRKIVISPSLHQWIKDNDSNDIFNLADDADSAVLHKIYNTHEQLEVNTDFHIFHKILKGDDGDDVPNIWTWTNEKGVPKRVTDAPIDKIWERMSINGKFDTRSVIDDEKVFDALRMNLELFCKITFNAEEIIQLKENYTRNRLLMELSNDTIPQEIQQYVEEQIINLPYIQQFDVKTFTAGTKYEKNVEIKSDIFNGLVDDGIESKVISSTPKTQSLF